MDRNSAVMMAIGFCLAVSGCALTPCGAPCGQGGGCGLGRRCSDCTPPRVPGCKYNSCVDEFVVYRTGKSCGHRALARYRRQCDCPISADFSAGFVQSHVDLASGRGPLPPSLPPSRYWSAYYRSCAGRPRVEDWYAGYDAGLEVGLNGGVSQFRRIDVRMTGCPGG